MHKKYLILNSQHSLKPVTNDQCPMDFSLIDTHCHLEMGDFDPDREKVLERAKNKGIKAIITIGSDMEGNIGGLELSKKYDFIYSAVGFHPHDAVDFTEETYTKLKEWVIKFKIQNLKYKIKEDNKKFSAPKIVAIGETGLDYHYNNSPRDVQKEVFKKQLQYAKEVDLPVIIHSREAKKDTLQIIKESGANKGVFHCFSGDMDMAEKAISMGFYISIAGPVTFKNARRLRDIAKAIPDDYLLIETDAPYLTPEPFRGKRNEPSYIIHTAKIIAEIRGITLEDIARITTINAKRLFNIGQMPQEGEIAYKIRDTLYLNITNRCTNKCTFCIRFHTDYVKGHNLRLLKEPTEEELKRAIGDPTQYKEVVFCGFGEPLLRLDLIKNVALWIKDKKGKVRINTNGHGNLIHKRNILPELKGMVDIFSISLNAEDEETYNKICKPSFKDAYKGVISFIREAKKVAPEVRVTVVTVKDVDVGKCKKIADELGVGFRVRRLNNVG